jgi:hypothetical protein
VSVSANEPFKLTPYDEMPVHQTPYPFSYLPSTDFMWDDGYWVGAVCPDQGLFLGTGVRVNANADIIGGYAILSIGGHQLNLRFNRCWSRQYELRVGPYRIEIIEPLKKLRFALEKNDSGLSFDLLWEGVSPPFLEHHHMAVTRNRRSTDLTRYSQSGKVSGVLELRGKRYVADPQSWTGVRDHSWGVYADRLPLSPPSSLLLPKPARAQRSLRIWSPWRADPYSGVFHLHENELGEPYLGIGDPFGGPFEGHINKGWSDEPIHLVSAKHTTEFETGTRLAKRANLEFTDEAGGKWLQEFTIAAPPLVVACMGYTPGSWKDGGTFHTYHGSEELAIEWDEFDFSRQPVMFTPYKVSGEAARDSYGTGASDYDKPIQGIEYCARVKLTTPQGDVHHGACQFEQYINGPYAPYGFK